MKRYLNIVITMLSVCVLVACQAHNSDQPIRHTLSVKSDPKYYIQQVDTDLITRPYLDSLAQHFKEHGLDMIDLMISYDPESIESTKLEAADQVEKIKGYLATQDVVAIRASVIPMRSLGEKTRAILSYGYYEDKYKVSPHNLVELDCDKDDALCLQKDRAQELSATLRKKTPEIEREKPLSDRILAPVPTPLQQ